MKICNPIQAQRLIDNQLTPDETIQFEDHLETCESCQATLLTLSGGNRAQQTVKHLFDSSSEIRSWSEESGTLAHHRDDLFAPRDVFVDTSMLNPTDDPRSMGRIGNYEVQAVLGRGGMGVVFRAIDTSLRRNVAIKLLDPTLASVATARRRFALEARAMASISHEHVVPVYSVDEHRGIPYLAMEYIPGGTLEHRLQQQGVLSADSILRISRQIALALAAAHECGLVHRDIKPANVLLDRGVERVRVTDFGLARVNSEASQTRSGFVAGTPQFMSPEQVRGDLCTHRSDLFSLGAVMYAMCTGHSPFRSDSIYGSMQRIVHDHPRSIREQSPQIPDWMERFIMKLLAKDPKDRFASAALVADLLEQEIAHSQNPTIYAQPDRTEYPALKSFKQNSVWVSWGVGVGLLAICLLAGWLAWGYSYGWSLHPTATNTGSDTTKNPDSISKSPTVTEIDASLLWANDPTYPSHLLIEKIERQLNFSGSGLEGLDPFDEQLQSLQRRIDLLKKQKP